MLLCPRDQRFGDVGIKVRVRSLEIDLHLKVMCPGQICCNCMILVTQGHIAFHNMLHVFFFFFFYIFMIFFHSWKLVMKVSYSFIMLSDK
jgi:hypothetical protein